MIFLYALEMILIHAIAYIKEESVKEIIKMSKGGTEPMPFLTLSLC
jgi:hypothetical protein